MQVPWEGPRWEVVAALGGLKGGRADTLVEKISELGARSLRPLLTHRSRTIGQHSTQSLAVTVCVIRRHHPWHCTFHAGNQSQLLQQAQWAAWSFSGANIVDNLERRSAGRFEEKSQVRVVEVEELSDMSELEEAEDFAATGRMARWERVSMSAGKQSLR